MLNFSLLLAEVATLADISVLVWILYILGLIFVCVELFIPGFGVFGLTGVAALVAAIVILIVQGAPFVMILGFILVAVGVIAIAVTAMSFLLKSGKLKKNAIFNIGSSVPTDHTEGTPEYSPLIGKIGTTQNFLRPIGKVKFDDGEIVDVIARDGIIDEGVKVVVVSVDGQAVKVDRVKE
jgi:membrane-bound serine protease (ClpP class)